VTCIGNLGRTGLTRQLSAFNQQINAIIENEALLGKFIFYQAQSPSFKLQLESLSAATTVAIVNKGKFETIKISIPPLAEQHRILEKIEELFSELDKGIETLKTAQQQLKVYRQAVLKYAFEGKLSNPDVKEGELPDGWENRRVEEFSVTLGGIAFKSSEFLPHGKYQVIRMGNVRPGIIRFKESPVFLSDVEEKVLSKGLLRIDDVIVTQTGTKGKRDYGFTALIKSENLLLNQRIAAIRCKPSLLPKYLLYYTWTDFFKNQFFSLHLCF
jgi:type I restriction enzyme S subunit